MYSPTYRYAEDLFHGVPNLTDALKPRLPPSAPSSIVAILSLDILLSYFPHDPQPLTRQPERRRILENQYREVRFINSHLYFLPTISAFLQTHTARESSFLAVHSKGAFNLKRDCLKMRLIMHVRKLLGVVLLNLLANQSCREPRFQGYRRLMERVGDLGWCLGPACCRPLGLQPHSVPGSK